MLSRTNKRLSIVKGLAWLLLFPSCRHAIDRNNTGSVVEINFNDHQIKEAKDRIALKPVGITLADDRFGNKTSAAYVHGNKSSYLSLGSSALLKSEAITVSLWVRIDTRNYFGKGYVGNPVILTRNSDREDFALAYCIFFSPQTDRINSGGSNDSLNVVDITSHEAIQLNRWYHLAFSFDKDSFSFYIDGRLESRLRKGFATQYNPLDSVVLGYSASNKNERYTTGSFDDIQFFHRVLSPEEIQALYEAPDPNRWRLLFDYAWKTLVVLMIIAGLTYLLLFNRRRDLKRKEEQFALSSKLQEMELRAVRAQMNPHFIFNSLNSIQHFVITQENEKAEFYLSRFSRLVRKLLESNTGDSIALCDELDILHRYLEMESLRFNHAFHYTISIDEKIDMLQAAIPHLMIQPFIENAIWHGLLSQKGEKHLHIGFTQPENTMLACTIDDNGVGRSYRKEAKAAHKEKSLAIGFIRQRLALFGKDRQQTFTLQITDKKNADGTSAGTRVEITLPLLPRRQATSTPYCKPI